MVKSFVLQLLEKGRDPQGQALAEFAIAFPLQLFLTMAMAQFLLLGMSAIMVNFAAYRACRAALVAIPSKEGESLEEARKNAAFEAARFTLAPLGGHPGTANQAQAIEVPGWGKLVGSDGAYYKLYVEVNAHGENDAEIEVILRFAQELQLPVVNALFRLFLRSPDIQKVQDPALTQVFGDLAGGKGAVAPSAVSSLLAAAKPGMAIDIQLAGGGGTITAPHYIIERRCRLARDPLVKLTRECFEYDREWWK